MARMAHLPPAEKSLQEVILLAGGYEHVAISCEIQRRAVYAWKTIPDKHVLTMARLTSMGNTELRPDLLKDKPQCTS